MTFKRASNADVTSIIGASGAGKSHWIRAQLPRLRRPVFVWDWMSEYGDKGKLRTSLADVLDDAKAGRPIIAFTPNRAERKVTAAQFHTLCGIVLSYPGCTFIAEELMHVTASNFAPARWLDIITGGRHLSLTVIGTTQRPALCDKTFLSGSTVVRCGFLRWKSDKKTMADIMNLPVDEISALQKRDWIQATDAGVITREPAAGLPPAKQNVVRLRR